MNPIRPIVALALIFALNGCSTTSTSSSTAIAAAGPAWEGPILVSPAAIPSGIEYKVIGTVQAEARVGVWSRDLVRECDQEHLEVPRERCHLAAPGLAREGVALREGNGTEGGVSERRDALGRLVRHERFSGQAADRYHAPQAVEAGFLLQPMDPPLEGPQRQFQETRDDDLAQQVRFQPWRRGTRGAGPTRPRHLLGRFTEVGILGAEVRAQNARYTAVPFRGERRRKEVSGFIVLSTCVFIGIGVKV